VEGDNPYAPPKSGVNAGDPGAAGAGAPAALERLPPDVELRAMQALGRRRSRAGQRAFAGGWLGSVALLMLFGLGFVPALLVGAAIGGAFSKFYVRHRKNAMIDAVCVELSIPRRAFAPDQYIID
jgi:hypothetical protein